MYCICGLLLGVPVQQSTYYYNFSTSHVYMCNVHVHVCTCTESPSILYSYNLPAGCCRLCHPVIHPAALDLTHSLTTPEPSSLPQQSHPAPHRHGILSPTLDSIRIQWGSARGERNRNKEGGGVGTNETIGHLSLKGMVNQITFFSHASVTCIVHVHVLYTCWFHALAVLKGHCAYMCKGRPTLLCILAMSRCQVEV